MQSRLESGYWVFHAPVGYRYVQARSGGGKVLVPDEQLAHVVRDALEGFATSRLSSQAEVARFLESNPLFPERCKKSGSVRLMTVNRMLKKVVHAGCVEAPKWGIGPRKGNHEGLISYETFEVIQQILEGRRPRPSMREASNEDFPLRGFLVCDGCGGRMTGGWSKGCREYYAYYRCMRRGCALRTKSAPRAKVEGAFAEILRSAQPAPDLIELAKAMLEDAWEMRNSEAEGVKAELDKELNEVNGKIESLLDRIVEATTPSVVSAYEARI
jgi:hypothetical protein